MCKHAGARHFIFCLLLQHLLLSALLTVEYPSKSAPPVSGEEGGEFPGHSFAGQDLGGLPHGWLVGTLEAHPHPASSAGLVLTGVGGALPTNGGVESISLETWLETSLPGCSIFDHCFHLSDDGIVWHQLSASGIGFTVKCTEWEIHSENASPTSPHCVSSLRCKSLTSLLIKKEQVGHPGSKL